MKAQQREAEARRQAEAQSITLRDYAERWLTAHVASDCHERTAEQYRSTLKHHLYPTLGHLPLGDIKRTHIRSLIADKAAAGLSRSTLRNIAVPLRAMLNAAVEEERIPGNPAARLFKRQRGRTENEAKKVTTLTEEELTKILTAASSDFAQHADIMFTLAWTGLRVSEACGLQWSDLNLDGHYLEVNRAVAYRQHRVIVGAPKSGKARRVDLPRDLVERFHRRLSVRQTEAMVGGHPLSPWVFPAPSNDTKPMNASFILPPLQGLVQAPPRGRRAACADSRSAAHLREPSAARRRANAVRQGTARTLYCAGDGGPVRARPPGAEPWRSEPAG